MYLAKSLYRIEILKSLYKRGGSATVNEVSKDVFEALKDQLSYEEINTQVSKNEPIWRNKLRWVKNELVNDYLLATTWMPYDQNCNKIDIKRGRWYLSNLGAKELKKWVQLV